MRLSAIEKQVVAAMHDLPPEKQQSILDFSRFVRSMALGGAQNTPAKRQAGLGKGKSFISEDFDEPLPDEFWLGEDEK